MRLNAEHLFFGPSSFLREDIFCERQMLMRNHYIALSENNEYERFFSNVFTFFLEHLLLNVQYSPVGCLKIFLIVMSRILSYFESLHSSWLWHAVVYVGRSRVASPTLNTRSLKSTTTQPAVGVPKTFWEDQRAGDLKKRSPTSKFT